MRIALASRGAARGSGMPEIASRLLRIACRATGAALVAAALVLALAPGRRAEAQSSTGSVYVNVVELDIAPDQMAKFLELAKDNAAAAVKEPGCREFNIQVLASNPNHVMFYEVYDNEAALATHRAGEHYKAYAAATAKMVTARNVRGMSGVLFNAKPH